MKLLIVLLAVSILIPSCSRRSEIEELKLQIDSLKQNSYKPGFGEFMSAIQVHHAKLWFAGINQNWQLADFEVREIRETLKDLQKYQMERKESEMVIIVDPPLDSIELSIQRKNSEAFRTAFISLTNTCNNCHKQVDNGFNSVKIPDSPPFSNQSFENENRKDEH